MARNVTVIPQTILPLTGFAVNTAVKRRVAAYARVSTDSDEQQTSYEAQVKFYTNYIKSKPEYEFVKVYTDEGITGLNTKRRDGFKEMVDDALNGKIDLIITKSVSRFARNTVDTIMTVRKLKEHGVEVYFEKENIYTMDGKGELLITIMSSLAQEESRSISENVTWGHRKSFADGKVSLAYKKFLGYEKGEDGLPKVNKEQAKIVKRIYELFICGKTPSAIADLLTEEGIPTPCSKQKWQSSTILSMLQNEKYKGAALLQKSFTVDFLTKKTKVNEGEVPQYYIENSHEAIIEPIIFDWVQCEIARRKKFGRAYSGKGVLGTKLICDDCGGYYGSKVWQSNTKYRKEIWQCNGKFKNGSKCNTPYVTEEEVKTKFLQAYRELTSDMGRFLQDAMAQRNAISDCSEINKSLEKLQDEIEKVTELARACIEDNNMATSNQLGYIQKYNGYIEKYDRLKEKIDKLNVQKRERESKGIYINGMIKAVTDIRTELTEFDEKLWMMTVDYVRIKKDGKMKFVFRDGSVVEL